jgi:hypothetical protein
MDELWQRYRAFWTPVLWGIGAFLAGLIVVHILTNDPETGVKGNENKANALKRQVAPNATQIRVAKETTVELENRMASFAKLLDQRHGDAEDAITAYAQQALTAAILRGRHPADPASFEGDTAQAALANTRYEELLTARLKALQSQDPNVSFSRLKADVVQELAIRANRADVDVDAEEFGLSIASVDRTSLPRYLANLALLATVIDVAIREGVRSIDAVVLMPTEVRGSIETTEPFLQEWPIKVDVTGPPETLAAILDLLTDPRRPTALGSTSWKQVAKKEGLVKGEFKIYSVRVRPGASLGLEKEEG